MIKSPQCDGMNEYLLKFTVLTISILTRLFCQKMIRKIDLFFSKITLLKKIFFGTNNFYRKDIP